MAVFSEKFMLRALELARNGVGLTSPNPAVGAVIVYNGKIVGEGWHKKAGKPHAEIEAISSVKNVVLKDCELYVTLEPCCHHGKTPPCTDAIVRAGFKKVFVGMTDPFAKVDGKGVKILRNAGVQVQVLRRGSKLRREIAEMNQPFIKWARTGLPYVTLKAGISLDGKIAVREGSSTFITGPVARNDARLERSKYDAVLVGSGTVAVDDCELAAHGKYAKKGLLRIIFDKDLSLSLDRRVFRDENVFVVTTKLASEQSRQRFASAGVDFKVLGEERIDIDAVLRYFGEWGVQSIFVEGGVKVHKAFFDAGVFDQVLFYIAPKIVGENGLSLEGDSDLKNITVEKIGKDLKLRSIKNFYS